jgi:Tol biopolymer transport system component
VNIENLEVSALPENLGECVTPSWSHVENKIAVSCWSDTDEGVYIYDFANAAITKLELGKRCYKPQWSPDGEKIACIAQYVESIKYQDIQPPHDALYIMDKNGENLTRITFREEENIYWFSWVPDNGNLQECWGLCQ